MTVITTFRCDLCSNAIAVGTERSEGMPGYGLYFLNSGPLFKAKHETSKHICLKCAKSIHDEVRKITPAD